jgi:hypothetical protein
MANDVKKLKEELSPIYPTKMVVFYTILLGFILCTAFIILLATIPKVDIHNFMTNLDSITNIFIFTILLMTIAGGIGGCLYNFRGLIKHSADADYSYSYNLSYYLRPLAGAISGLIVFFLLLGGALTLNIDSISGNNNIPSWATFPGRMPYIVFALLAGYSSHEFMLKMKDISESIFALRRNQKDGE